MRFRFAAILACAVLPAAASAQETIEGAFTARFEASRVHLNLQTTLDFDGNRSRSGWSNYGRTLELANVGAIDRSSGRVRFTLRREAGTFTFDGRGSGSRASGDFTFTPSRTFAQNMDRLGYDDLNAANLFVFALEDVTVAGTRQLEQQVSDRLDTRQLVRMINHGAGPRYVNEMTGAGFRDLDSDEYVKARDHGVDADFAREMRELNLRLSLSELIRSRDHGVNAEFARQMRQYDRDMTHEEMIRSRDHGVSAEFIREMHALGHRASHDELVKARDHGVSPDFIREMEELGYRDLPLADYVRFRDHGVNADFAHELAELGYKSLTPNQLVRLRDHGVTARYVRRAKELFREPPTVEQLIKLRSSGAIN